MRPIALDIDAQPRQPQHGLCHLGDRWVAQRLHHNGVIVRGAYRYERRTGRIHNIQDLARRLLVGQLSRQRQRGG